MTITVAALKRALIEMTADRRALQLGMRELTAIASFRENPTLLTILAEHLSVREPVRSCLGCVNVANACDACRPNLQRALDAHFGKPR